MVGSQGCVHALVEGDGYNVVAVKPEYRDPTPPTASHPSGMTRDQYWRAGKKLADGGHWPPPGLLAHVSFGRQDDLRVSEVWESREQQEQFAQALLPILEDEGIGFASEPEFLDVEAYELKEARTDPPYR